MQLYTGFYQGATVVRLWSVGHGSINATLQSGSVIQGELNPEITHRLHRMAVTDRLAKVKENPFALVMPHGQPIAVNAAAQEAIADLGENVPHNVDVNVFDISSNDEHRMSPVEINDMSEPLLVVPHASADVERMAEAAHTDMAQKTLASDSLFDGSADVANVDLEDADTLMDAHEVLGEMHNVCSSNANEDQSTRDEGTPPMEKDRITDCCTSSASLSSKRDMSCVNGEGQDIDPVLHSGRDSCGNLRAFDGPCYEVTDEDAQAVGDTIEITGSIEAKMNSKRSRSKKEIDKPDDGKPQRILTEEEKTEIRKKRNREAAARSNLKRKLRNEKVRKDLANLTQKAVKLRVREMMLRDENTRLRNEVRRAKLLVPH
ncbi:Basic-leucine zipper [Gracilaria domingensis]|nr:Basic-leucine zipper [Gracilaria domingensis]